jgi:uncharacterized membrane protein HdeD (DUF308 family)
MLETLTRFWWLVVLRGVAAVIFGLLAVIWPGVTLIVLAALFALYVIVDGLVALGTAAFGRHDPGRRGWLVVEGIAGVVIGVVVLAWPHVTTLALLWLIAAWALLTGILEIVTAVLLRRDIQGEWMLALGGALSVLFGILLAIWPATGALALVVLIGVYAIIFGVVLVGLGLRLHRVRRQTGTVANTGRPATA